MAENDIEVRETRRSLKESMEADDNEVITVAGDDDTGGSAEGADTPEQAAAALAAAIKERDAEREGRIAAERTAAEKTNAAAGAAAATLQSKAASIESALQSRDTIIENAEAALKAAVEANDAMAMSKANREIARAEAEKVDLERQKTWVAHEQERLKTQPLASAPTRTGPTAESLAWMESNPRINVDPKYQAAVAAADSAWRARGMPVGTKDYVNFIDSNMRAAFGSNHGTMEAFHASNGGAVKAASAKKTPASSSAAPPERGGSDGDGNGGGVNAAVTFKHGKGQISLKRNADGKETISGTIPPDWVAAAKWSGYTRGKPDGTGGKFKTDEEGVHAYAVEQLKAIGDRQSGIGETNYGEGVRLQ